MDAVRYKIEVEPAEKRELLEAMPEEGEPGGGGGPAPDEAGLAAESGDKGRLSEPVGPDAMAIEPADSKAAAESATDGGGAMEVEGEGEGEADSMARALVVAGEGGPSSDAVSAGSSTSALAVVPLNGSNDKPNESTRAGQLALLDYETDRVS